MTASAPNSDRVINVTDASLLTPAHALFAALVAGGETYSKAAESSGFARDTGRALARQPAIQLRIQELQAEPTKAQITAMYWRNVIRTEAAVEDDPLQGGEAWRANMALHMTALDKLARFKGWLVERKQVSQVTARVNVARGDLEAAIRADVERLAPGALRRIESGEADLKSIAAGTQAVVVDASSRPEDKAKA